MRPTATGAKQRSRSIRAVARDLVRGRYDLSAVVRRTGRVSRWVGFKILRLYEPPSLVSRQSAVSAWFDANVRHELPTLYHFDIHLTDHCNLNCKGCAHFSSLCKPWFVDPTDFAEDMKVMSERVRVQQIFLLGGEPLLHPEIVPLMKTARHCFPKTRICTATNGLLLMRMSDEFWRTLVEERIVLVVDGYPIDLPRAAIIARAAEFGVALEWTSESGRFFKVPLDLSGSQNPTMSYRRCGGITNCPLYKHGRLYPCAYPPYIDAFREQFGIEELAEDEQDSISVSESSGEQIVEFLKRPIPFCRYCDFDHFEEYDWGRSSRTIDEWTTAARASNAENSLPDSR
jgi:hypothetical protein